MIRTLALSFVLLSPLFHWRSNAQTPEDLAYGSKQYESARKAFSEERYEEVGELLANVHPSDSVYERCLHLRTLALVQQDRYTDALPLCQEGVALHGEQEAYFGTTISALHFDLKDWERALSTSAAMMAEHPGLFRPHHLHLQALAGAGRKEDALKQALYNVRHFPYQRDAHIWLGVAAFNDGHITEAAMALAMAQMLRFDDRKADETLGYYDGILGGRVEPGEKQVTLNTGDHYEELEQLLLNRVAMAPKYRSEPDLDYPMCRQSHLLFTSVAQMPAGDGFFGRTYAPLMKDIVDQGLLPGFIYHCLNSSSVPDVRKHATKNKSKVEDFRKRIGGLVAKRFTRYPEVEGGPELHHFFNSDEGLGGYGATDASGEIPVGEWSYFHPNGRPSAKGSLDEQGRKKGEWTIYHSNGKPARRSTYVEDKEDGVILTWNPDGVMKDSLTISKGVYTGTHCEYHIGGGRRRCRTMANDQYTGAATEYYTNGQVNYTYETVDDRINGTLKGYAADGTLELEATYAMGKLTGKWTSYHADGKVDQTVNYVNGLAEGPFSSSDAEGVVRRRGVFKADKLTGEVHETDAFGTPSKIQRFDDQGRSHGLYEEFNGRGGRYLEMEYTRDLLMKYRYVAPDGTVKSEGTRSKGKFQFNGYSPEGTLSVQGVYLDEGAKDGRWTYYEADGTVDAEESHANGKETGEQKYYDKVGRLKSIHVPYEDGRRSFKEFHPNGTVSLTGQTVDGEWSGVFRRYHPDGRPSAVNYYVDGVRWGWQRIFDAKGRLLTAERVEGGALRERVNYDHEGKEYERVVVQPGDFQMVLHHTDGTVSDRISMKNGFFDGPYEQLFPNGKPANIGTYRIGKYHGPWKGYTEDGKLRYEQVYRLGELEGHEKQWHANGKLRMERDFVHGNLHGKQIEYGITGVKLVEREKAHDMDHGTTTSYCFSGEPQLRRYYFKGRLIGFSSPLANGGWSDTIPVTPGRFTIEATFPGGRPSRIMPYRNGELDGDFKEYFPNGQLMESLHYTAGEADGEDLEYYANGQLREQAVYRNGLLEGTWTRYWENGKPMETREYINGEFYGTQTFHDGTGRVIATYYVRDGDTVPTKP